MNRRGLARLPTGGFSSVVGGCPVRRRLIWTCLGSSSSFSSPSSFFSSSSLTPSGNAYSTSRLYTTGPFFASPLSLSSYSSAPISSDASSNSSSPLTEGGEKGITVEDALRGSQQAYYAVGLVLKKVIDGLEEEPPTDTPLEMADLEHQHSRIKKQTFVESHSIIRDVLQKHFLDGPSRAASSSSNPSSSPSPSSDNDDASSSTFKSSEKLEQRLTKIIGGVVKKEDIEEWKEEYIKSVKQLQKVLPVSDCLAIELVMLLITREALNVSCSDDFIFASSCVQAELLPKVKPESSEKEVKTSVVLCQSKALSPEELKKRSTSTPLIPKSGLTEMKGKESSEQASKTEDEFTVRSFKVRHAVVTPPQRYNRMYPWFYERLIGYRSPNERIVVANLLAQLSNFSLFKGFDFLARLLTGKQVQLPTGHFLRVIQNIAGEVLDHSVPIVYKDMTFSQDTEDGKWVLESITTHKSTDCVFVPKS